MRTSSDPARASARTGATVDSTSAVSVFVIDWTTTGAAPPTVTEPMRTGVERRRFRDMGQRLRGGIPLYRELQSVLKVRAGLTPGLVSGPAVNTRPVFDAPETSPGIRPSAPFGELVVAERED